MSPAAGATAFIRDVLGGIPAARSSSASPVRPGLTVAEQTLDVAAAAPGDLRHSQPFTVTCCRSCAQCAQLRSPAASAGSQPLFGWFESCAGPRGLRRRVRARGHRRASDRRGCGADPRGSGRLPCGACRPSRYLRSVLGPITNIVAILRTGSPLRCSRTSSRSRSMSTRSLLIQPSAQFERSSVDERLPGGRFRGSVWVPRGGPLWPPRSGTHRPLSGKRARRWAELLEKGVYPSRAALARGEGVSRAAVTQAFRGQ